MLVTLYTSRVILNTLGVEDFGIYNVVGGFVSMLSFLNGAMSNATQRFLSFEIGKGDFVQLRKTFNATLIVHIGLAIVILILAETVGLWFVKTYLIIPAERMNAAMWVYHFSVLSLMVSVAQVPFNATIVANERMNVYAYISILEVALKLLIAFILFWISFDKLKLYGILHISVVFAIAAIYRIYTRRNFNETKFELVKDKELYKSLVSFSGWSLFSHIAYALQGQGVNMLLNIFFGPVVNAARGIAVQVRAALDSFASNFQIAINPQIVKSYASGDKEYMTSLIIRGSKFSFYLLFLMSLPIILEINQVLRLWLKTVPVYSSIFTILVLVIVLIECISRSLTTGIQATGKIKVYQSVVGSLRILILPISYIFLKYGYSPEVTLYINIIISIITLFIRLYIVWNLLDFQVTIFLKEIILKNIIIVPLAFSLPFIVRNLMDESLIRLLIITIISMIWNGTIIYFIGLQKSEKNIVKKVYTKISKIKY